MPTSIEFYSELYSKYTLLNYTALMFNATMEFTPLDERHKIEGQAVLLEEPYKCFYASCEKDDSILAENLFAFWKKVGPMKVQDFPPNPNPEMDDTVFTTVIDYNPSPGNRWGNKRLQTKGHHNMKTKKLHGVGRAMEVYRDYYLREG